MNSTLFKTLSLLMSVFVFTIHASDGQWSLKNKGRALAYRCCLSLNKARNPTVPFAAVCSSAIATKCACDFLGIEMTEENTPEVQASILGESMLLTVGAAKVVNYACNRLAISCAMNSEKKKND